MNVLYMQQYSVFFVILEIGEAPLVRPRRLSMTEGSEFERSLARELLGVGRVADRFMGEEEAEREVRTRSSGWWSTITPQR